MRSDQTFFSFGVVAAGVVLSTGSALADWQDPFRTRILVADSPTGGRPELARPCVALGPKLLSVSDVIERALCNNPQTREAWAQARAQAAQLGVTQAAFLPSVSVGAGSQRNRAAGESVSQQRLQATLSYLLFDSGQREAVFEAAHQLLVAANSRQEAVVQQVFFSAAAAYYRAFSVEAVVAAQVQSEAAALGSLNAARARLEAGVGTPSEVLQAQTAWSSAVLDRIRAEGEARNSRGVLANVVGLDANVPLHIEPPSTALPTVEFDNDVDRLIDYAKRLRPDLVAARAQANVARSNLEAARAAGLPTITLGASRSMLDETSASAAYSSSVGVTLSIPAFQGFATTYRVQAAREDLDARLASRDTIERQVTLEVWQSYQNLATDTQALRATADLLASAEQAYQVTLGRYQAGVGAVTELLNAQSAQAQARSLAIEARFKWHISRFALGQAVGQLDFGMLDRTQVAPR